MEKRTLRAELEKLGIAVDPKNRIKKKDVVAALQSLASAQKWMIIDWAGNVLFKGETWKSFDDAEEFLTRFIEKHYGEDSYEENRGEYYIEEVPKRKKSYAKTATASDRDIEKLVESAAQGALESWAYNKYEEDAVEEAGDSIVDTFLANAISKQDQIGLAEELWEEVGYDGVEETIRKNGLSYLIETSAMAAVDMRARNVFMEAAQDILDKKKDLEMDAVGYANVTISSNDPFGWTPPVSQTDVDDMVLSKYRNVEGDIDADVYEYKVLGSGIHFVCYLDKD
jgi:uncharacterized protein (DUF1697 family)